MARPVYSMGGKKQFAQYSRLQQQARNNLGTIMSDQLKAPVKFRDDNLDVLDQYYESRQYDNLQDWNEAAKQEIYVPVRDRKPRIVYNVAKVLVDKVAAKIVGQGMFPDFHVEEDPDDTAFFRVVQKACGFRRHMVAPIKHLLISGSVFVRFYVVDGNLALEHANAKYCYPQFDPSGDLNQMEIKYIFEDVNDKTDNGKAKWKWYRIVLTKTSDILYDNPEYKEGVTPDFVVVEQVDHDLGWVQGEWLRTSKKKHDPDGDSLIIDILPFIDELNYSLSQTSQAVAYNQEPQLAVNAMDEDEVEKLIKSAQKSWNLGKDGKAAFIESNMKGVETAEASRDHMRQFMLDVVRVVLHDPEKMATAAQSGEALKVLNAPLVELIDELRTSIEPSLVNLLIKIGLTMLELHNRGEETILEVPDGYLPSSLDLTVAWPPIFPITIQDLQAKAQVAVAVSGAMLISRESLTRWLAPDFGIENIDEELQKLADEPVFNPFTGFGPPADIPNNVPDKSQQPPPGKGPPK